MNWQEPYMSADMLTQLASWTIRQVVGMFKNLQSQTSHCDLAGLYTSLGSVLLSA